MAHSHEGKQIAVDDSLAPVRELLTSKGYSVTSLESGLNSADAVVLNGMDDNLEGIETVRTKAPTINAEGLSPEDVLKAIENSLAAQPAPR